ncbi:YncE family protein (plasmid) [Kitasatospora sp. NBC_00070]|uniref:beta-propeller fold lactonase family protein n=1 Tax=Kitasatospora sp. NBC_00070 TaxID=2975962 RepID=UPI003252F9B7
MTLACLGLGLSGLATPAVAAPIGQGEIYSHLKMPHTPTDIALSPDGSRMYIADPGSTGTAPKMYVSNEVTNVLQKSSATLSGNPIAIAPSPDGKYVYAVLDNGKGAKVAVIDTRSTKVVRTVDLKNPDGPGGNLTGVDAALLSLDGSKLYLTLKNESGEQHVFVYETGKKGKAVSPAAIVPANTESPLTHLVASPDGKQVYAVADAGHWTDVIRINTATNTVTDSFQPLNTIDPSGDLTDVADAAVSPDGKRLYLSSEQAVFAYDTTRNGAPVAAIETPAGIPGHLAVSPDSTHVYVAGVDNSGPAPALSLSVIDAASATVTGMTPLGYAQHDADHESELGKVIASPDGTRVYIVNNDADTILTVRP